MSSLSIRISCTFVLVDLGCLYNVLIRTGFDVNFMDDMGQTLLNWAAAFGPTEMVCWQLHYAEPVTYLSVSLE